MPMPRRIIRSLPPSGPGGMGIIQTSWASPGADIVLGTVQSATGKIFLSATRDLGGGNKEFIIARYNAADLAYESSRQLSWGTANSATRSYGISPLSNGNLAMTGVYRNIASNYVMGVIEVNPTTLASVKASYVDNGSTLGRWNWSVEYNGSLYLAGRAGNFFAVERWLLTDFSYQNGRRISTSGDRWFTVITEHNGFIYAAGYTNNTAVVIRTNASLVEDLKFNHYLTLGSSEGNNRYDGLVAVGNYVFASGRMQQAGINKGYIVRMAHDTLAVQVRSLHSIDSRVISLCSDGTYLYAVGIFGDQSDNTALVERYDLNLNRLDCYRLSNSVVGSGLFFSSCFVHNGVLYASATMRHVGGQNDVVLCSFDFSGPISVPYSPPCLPNYVLEDPGITLSDPTLTTNTNLIFTDRITSPAATTITDSALTPTNVGPC